MDLVHEYEKTIKTEQPEMKKRKHQMKKNKNNEKIVIKKKSRKLSKNN